MSNSPPILIFVALLGGLCGLGLVCRGKEFRPKRLSLLLGALAVLPGFLMLTLFYSLALHMHHSLGGWPSSTGTRGFPPALALHAKVTGWWFSTLLLASILAWPVAVQVCWAVRRWRRALIYLGIHAMVCAVSFANMLLAPEPFLYWWWD